VGEAAKEGIDARIIEEDALTETVVPGQSFEEAEVCAGSCRK
jgi:hypothetical protein